MGHDQRLDPGRTPPLVLSDVADVRAGYSGTCARKTDGTVLCWGDSDYGQLGNGTTNPVKTPSATLW